MGEPTIIILVNTDIKNWPSNSYKHRLVHLSALITKASLCIKRKFTQRLTISQGTDNKKENEK